MHSSTEHPCVDVAIIGAGFCGAMVAVNLLRSAKGHIDVALIERSGTFGKGLAYGTRDHAHLLNVPAAKMGAFSDDHEHFFRWACNHPGELRHYGLNHVTPGSFLPRELYGRYVSSLLDEAENMVSSGVGAYPSHRGSLQRISAEAIDVAPQSNGELKVRIRNAPDIIAKHVVLALGNFSPGDPKLRDQRARRHYPGSPGRARESPLHPWQPAKGDPLRNHRRSRVTCTSSRPGAANLEST